VNDLARLENLIDMFAEHGYSASMDVAMARVSLSSANTAKAFLRATPEGSPLPPLWLQWWRGFPLPI
jgi:hypothetical protein